MELFKLLGTIAIDNAEAKKALNDVSQEGGKTESKLGKFFGGVGKGAMIAGKAIGAGLAAGATACAGLATAAIKSYSDYEQLVGGVETLFGTRGAKSVEEYAQLVGKSVDSVGAEFEMLQQAQSDVMNNAANAYKTAGLSANEYMETANSLAAALNQSSASQLESAALADQAIIDMSDNANKMGTSMEAIQNAYNGFAKQNFTMLDNLKLGYGGTKEEMQRLLDDAGKIANTKFDISSFADITEAIHVMQEEMGIAGTTATEASTTIQGSLGMLKGAWSNLMVGLSDPEADLTSLINNVFESVTTFASNLVPRVTQVLSGIATALSQLVPLITNEIPNLMNQVLPPLIEGAISLVNGLIAAMPGIISAITAVLPMLVQGVTQLITQLASALPQIIQPVVQALPQVVTAILQALPTLIPAFWDASTQIVMMLCQMLPQLIQPIIDNLPTIIIAIVNALVTNLPIIIQGLIQLTIGIVAALPVIIQTLVDALPTIISMIVQALLTNLPMIIMGLVQLVGGIVAALPQIFGSLIAAIPAALSGIWTGLNAVFGGLGEWFNGIWQNLSNVPGLAQLKTTIETVWNGIKTVISTVLNSIKTVVSTAWNSIKNVISTVLNAVKNVISTAWNAIKTIVSNVMSLISSVLKGDWEGVKTAISNILNAIKSVIQSVWNGIKSVISSVLNGIKSVVSSVWNGIKSVISSTVNTIKTVVSNAWNGIKSTISSVLNGIKSTASSAWNNIKNTISTAINNIKSKVTTGFNNIKNTILNAFNGMASKLASVGKNLVQGIWNGISGAAGWIKSKISGWVGDVTSFIKNLFGIASPSILMRDEVGRYIAEGVAVGIEENTNAVTSAMKNMGDEVVKTAKENLKKEKKGNEELNAEVLKVAKEKLDNYKTYNTMTAKAEAKFWDDIRKQIKEGTSERIEADKSYFEAKNKIDSELLDSAKDRLEEYQVYNTMTLAEEVGFWDEIRQQCEEGTDARLEADKKYFDAKKSLDEKLKSAEEELQKSLAETTKKVADRANSILDSFNLMKVFESEALEGDKIFENLDSHINAMEAYQERMAVLEEKIGNTTLYSALKDEGLSALNLIGNLSYMSDDALNEYVKKYEKSTELAQQIAKNELNKETIAETKEAYRTFADSMAEIGVEVVEEAKIMKVGAVNHVKDMLKEFKEACESFSVSVRLKGMNVSVDTKTPSFVYGDGTAVEWFDKAMNKPLMMNSPTIFGYNAANGKYLGGGESGSEVVSGTDTLMTMIEGVVAEQNNAVVYYLQKVIDVLAAYFPQLMEAFNVSLDVDGRKLAYAIAEPMDEALGKLSSRKDRGRK